MYLIVALSTEDPGLQFHRRFSMATVSPKAISFSRVDSFVQYLREVKGAIKMLDFEVHRYMTKRDKV